MASRTIHIGNLSSQTTEETLRSYFSQCGQITNLKLAGDPNYPARFAFIEYSDAMSASQACTLFNGLDLGGKAIKIQFAKNPISSPAVPFQKNSHIRAVRYSIAFFTHMKNFMHVCENHLTCEIFFQCEKTVVETLTYTLVF